MVQASLIDGTGATIEAASWYCCGLAYLSLGDYDEIEFCFGIGSSRRCPPFPRACARLRKGIFASRQAHLCDARIENGGRSDEHRLFQAVA